MQRIGVLQGVPGFLRSAPRLSSAERGEMEGAQRVEGSPQLEERACSPWKSFTETLKGIRVHPASPCRPPPPVSSVNFLPSSLGRAEALCLVALRPGGGGGVNDRPAGQQDEPSVEKVGLTPWSTPQSETGPPLGAPASFGKMEAVGKGGQL